ncbi:MAG: rhodanese-like domain-containing protein [Chitinophagaceae bacterium]|nr:MAG: rhodanese-like domain-containing protein [Chitinophagaceae bacterium]
MDLNQEEWASRLNEDTNAFVLDVRTADECEDGIIPRAQNIDIYRGQGFIYEIDELDRSKNYYVYCKAGSRSAQACSIMSQMGFENTYNLVGGFMNWTGETALPK